MEKIICSFFLLTLFCEIPSIEAQRSLQQYLQLAGMPYSSILPTPHNPAVPNPLSNSHISPNPTLALPRQPLPPMYPTQPAFPALSLSNLLAALSQPATEKPLPRIQAPATSNIDAKLLNNLAVALQLLIVSNILNSPPPEVMNEKIIEVKPEVVQSIYSPPEINYNPPQPQYYLSQEQILPVVSYAPQNYVEQNPSQNYQTSRRGLSLIQSPYEALASSSPYVDPLTQYSSINTRKELQSPYSMLDKDVGLFSMSDLF